MEHNPLPPLTQVEIAPGTAQPIPKQNIARIPLGTRERWGSVGCQGKGRSNEVNAGTLEDGVEKELRAWWNLGHPFSQPMSGQREPYPG